MQYRDFGQTGWKASALGFGAMRLPTGGEDPRGSKIDEAEAVRMIRAGIDAGINYLDTAYVYHGGNSERVVGKALRDGYRERVKIATKSPVWMIHEPADFDRYLAEQLDRLQTDHVDFYLLHGLNQKTWRGIVLQHKLLEKSEQAIRDGRIRHIGFSFHDEFSSFVEILNGYDRWTFCQIQYNYMDIENQAGAAGLHLAAEKGLGVVVMEPLLGGRLANPPAPIRELYQQSSVKRSPADLALQWVWNHPEVSTILSGMSEVQQLRENLASAEHARANSLQPHEVELVEKLRAAYLERTAIPCTKCGYCMPCKNGVNILKNFELYNDAHLHEDIPGSRFVYKYFFPLGEHAEACQACHECEDLCPQKIPISDWMPKVAAELG